MGQCIYNLGENFVHTDTSAQYLKLANRLIKEYEFTCNINSWRENPEKCADWFKEHVTSSKLCRATARLYRNSLAHFFEQHNMANLGANIRSVDISNTPSRGEHTSSRKAKSLSQDDIKALSEYLSNSGSQNDIFLLHFLWAARVSGLRPSEWQHAVFENRILTVKNGKFSQDRANGEYRHLYFTDADHDDAAGIIAAFMELLQERLKNVPFPTLYDRCRTRLYKVASRLFPRRKLKPSLYSARHQFSADIKRNLPHEVVAALMGHASALSAGYHYAHSSKGEDHLSPPIADPREVETVRNVEKTIRKDKDKKERAGE